MLVLIEKLYNLIASIIKYHSVQNMLMQEPIWNKENQRKCKQIREKIETLSGTEHEGSLK